MKPEKDSLLFPKQVSKSTEETMRVVDKVVAEKRQAVFKRFPLLLTLLATFGVVATLYGFERIIDTIPIFAENPFILFVVGLLALAFTGTLYKKLGS